MHQPATSRRAAWACAALLALGVAACSSDDGGDPPSTPANPTATTSSTLPPATSSTTTAATTTITPDTTTTTPPTTPPPTTSVEDLKAQIAADYVAAYERLSARLANPTLHDLDGWLTTVATPGSEYEAVVRDRVAHLVEVGDITIPDDPPVNNVSVESIELDADVPPTGATLTICHVENLKTVTPADRSPVGEEIVAEDAQLAASRYSAHVSLTANGWLRDDFQRTFLEYTPGALSCTAS